ncbi:MAG TPA: argininosuccinate synthase domain-containing protein [Verrucomicrobiae bacterium]
MKIVLAYSGGLDTSVLMSWIKEKYNAEMIGFCADIHPNYVGRIERGECAPTVEILLKIAKALNVRPYRLFLKL